MKNKQSSPGTVAILTFAVIFIGAICVASFGLLFGPLLPPILPWATVFETINTILAYAAIGGPVLAYFWAKTRQQAE